MEDAEAVVTETYGMFVHTDNGEGQNFDCSLDDKRLDKGRATPGADNRGSDRSRTVAV